MTMTSFELMTFVPVVALGAAAIVVHALGERRLAGQGLYRPDGCAARSWMFRAGALLAVLVILPPVGSWAAHQLFARSIVDAILAFGVAPLVVLSAPWRAFGVSRRAQSRPSTGGGRSSRAPVVAVGVFAGVVLLWHVPVVVDASAGSAPMWGAQMACYLVAGVLLWLQLVGSDPFEPAWDPLARTWLVAVVLAGLAVIAAALLFGSGNWYPAFGSGRHHLISWELDQGFAGAIGGILPAVPLGAFVWWAYTEWLHWDEDDSLRVIRLFDVRRSDTPKRDLPRSGPSLHPLSTKEGST